MTFNFIAFWRCILECGINFLRPTEKSLHGRCRFMRVAILHVFPELYGNVCKIVFASKNTPYGKYVNQFCLSYKTQNATASGGEIRKCAEQFSTQEIIFKNLIFIPNLTDQIFSRLKMLNCCLVWIIMNRIVAYFYGDVQPQSSSLYS